MSYVDWMKQFGRECPPTAAGRRELVMQLLRPAYYDASGAVAGFGPPLITLKQALEILEQDL